MSEEPEKPADEEITGDAPVPDDAGGDAATADPAPAPDAAQAEDAPSRPHGDELSDAVDEVGAADGTDAEEPPADEELELEGEANDEEPEPGPEGEPDDEAPETEQPPAAAAPATTRRRARRDPGEAAPVVRAQAKYVRSSARKARLVCDHIRGKSVDEARAILAVTPRAIARDWSKLLESAVANAEHNHELVGEDLYVKAVHADEGPTIKRFRPRAMGRATRIRKRTSHLTILLTPKD
jgi:large subunit ribosomal protein L22